MSNDLVNSLKAATINPVSVQDVPKLAEEARGALSNFRVNLRVKEELEAVLQKLDQSQDYQLSTEIASKVDNLIADNPNLVLSGGATKIAGNEAFGLNITPAEWRKSRGAILREMLSETYKNIKRWANQLVENFQRTWIELTTSTEVLESRLEALDSVLNVVAGIREGCTEVELNELIVRSLSKDGRMLTGDLSKGIQSEFNYITACLRVWEMEQIRYKNSVIRYFGNPKGNTITEIERIIPKLFNQRSKVDGDDEKLMARQTNGMLDGMSFQAVSLDMRWVKDNVIVPTDNTLYADSLSQTGYHVIKGARQGTGKVQMKILNLTQIYVIRDVVENIIARLKNMNQEDDAVNFNPDDVKDVLTTLRQGDTSQDRAYQYGLITADYQYDVNSFKTEVSSMLVVLASHFITMLSLHLECYNVE